MVIPHRRAPRAHRRAEHDPVGLDSAMRNVELQVRFCPDDQAISRLHALAFDGDTESVQPWSDRLTSHSVTWVGAFDEDT